MKRHHQRDPAILVPETDVARTLAHRFPAELLERTNQFERRIRPAAARSRGNGKPAPDDPGADGPTLFAQALDVERKSLLGVLGRFVDVFVLH